MFLYKFLPERYLSDFFDTGSIRLGSLHGFRDTISHTLARGDNSEGSHTVSRFITNEFRLTKDTDEPIISQIFIGPDEGYATLKNIAMLSERSSENAYIFCTCTIYSDETFRNWNNDCEETDSCYVIYDPYMFHYELTKTIKNSVYSFMNRNIAYSSDPIPYDSDEAALSPCFTKEISKYSWQNEHRAVWGVKRPSPNFSHWDIHCPNAAKYCKPFKKLRNKIISHFD